MRNTQYDERKNKTPRAAKQHVTDAAEQKRNSDRYLHASIALTGNTSRHDRAYCRPDSARRKQHADSGSRVSTDREDAFPKDSKQREYPAAESPSGFYKQRREDARSILDVLDAIDRLSNSE
jgi:hypothetical protein